MYAYSASGPRLMVSKVPASFPLSSPNLAARRMASQFRLNPAEWSTQYHQFSSPINEWENDRLTDGGVHDLRHSEVHPIAREVPVVGEAIKMSGAVGRRGLNAITHVLRPGHGERWSVAFGAMNSWPLGAAYAFVSTANRMDETRKDAEILSCMIVLGLIMLFYKPRRKLLYVGSQAGSCVGCSGHGA
jgi:hypothetical protein